MADTTQDPDDKARELAALDEQLAALRTRFASVTADLRRVLVTDLRAFGPKQARAAFVGDPATSSDLSAEQLAALKQRAGDLGARLSQQVDADLSNPAAWLAGPDQAEDPKALREAVDVWAVVTGAGAGVQALLAEFGYDVTVEYSAPRYFVDGAYFPSLAEHFWRLRAEIAALEAGRAERTVESTRERLAARWDET